MNGSREKSFDIICPYCFKTMKDTDVLFRSERFSSKEPELLPDEYDDIEDFKAKYQGRDKEKILKWYEEWEFFAETDDVDYNMFWEKFRGTTEVNYSDDKFGIKAYRRRIIDPKNPEHQKYLWPQASGDYFIRDEDGMVIGIAIKKEQKTIGKVEGSSEETQQNDEKIEQQCAKISTRRVCPYCHNPLWQNYGKSPVKFISVIGIAGAGKTVYLSQLLKKINKYVAKVGLTSPSLKRAALDFCENNAVIKGEALPNSTPEVRFQQPLFFELERETSDNRIVTHAFVMYDVAGEVFKSQDLVDNYAPFVRRADGVIVLITPQQFESISGMGAGATEDAPETALSAIHDIVTGTKEKSKKCDVPIAICLSKIDEENIQNALDDQLKRRLLEDVKEIFDSEGFPKPSFNAEEYTPIGEGLFRFIKTHEMQLVTHVRTCYSSYAYFAFTALGCPVEEKKEGERVLYRYPVGPVLPKRIEEPLLWLFYKFGYIGKNALLPNEIPCPNCGSSNTLELPENDRTDTRKIDPLGFIKKKVPVNRACKECGHRWEHNPN